MIVCAQCQLTHDKFRLENVDLSGWPKYYWNLLPKPETAEHYFCGPQCASAWHNENYLKKETNEQDQGQ